MAVTNPDLSPTGSAVQRQLLVSISAHAILGYSLYFVAVMQTAPPVWAVNIIEQLKPTLRALDTAARLSQYPFPAQVMILYAVLSSLLLGMYWVYYMFFVNHIIGQESYRGVCERLQQTGFTVKDRLAVGFVGVAILSMFGYELPISFFVEGGDRYRDYLNNWLSSALFSSSILSTTVLLIVSMTVGVSFVLAPVSIYLAFIRIHPRHQ